MGDIGTHAENLAEYVTGLKIKELCADSGDVRPRAPARGRRQRARSISKAAPRACSMRARSRRARRTRSAHPGLWREGRDRSGVAREPNTLLARWLDRPAEILRAGTHYGALSHRSRFNTRLPGGHPEGFIEAFANLYRNFALALGCRLAGERSPAGVSRFPHRRRRGPGDGLPGDSGRERPKPREVGENEGVIRRTSLEGKACTFSATTWAALRSRQRSSTAPRVSRRHRLVTRDGDAHLRSEARLGGTGPGPVVGALCAATADPGAVLRGSISERGGHRHLLPDARPGRRRHGQEPCSGRRSSGATAGPWRPATAPSRPRAGAGASTRLLNSPGNFTASKLTWVKENEPDVYRQDPQGHAARRLHRLADDRRDPHHRRRAFPRASSGTSGRARWPTSSSTTTASPQEMLPDVVPTFSRAGGAHPGGVRRTLGPAGRDPRWPTGPATSPTTPSP